MNGINVHVCYMYVRCGDRYGMIELCVGVCCVVHCRSLSLNHREIERLVVHFRIVPFVLVCVNVWDYHCNCCVSFFMLGENVCRYLQKTFGNISLP